MSATVTSAWCGKIPAARVPACTDALAREVERAPMRRIVSALSARRIVCPGSACACAASMPDRRAPGRDLRQGGKSSP
jgi:hypothetical protein